MKTSTLSGLLAAILVILFAACEQRSKSTSSVIMKDSIATIPPDTGFTKKIDGRQTNLYILKNKRGMEAALTNYGAHLIALMVPDKHEKPIDVVIGFDDIDKYKKAMSAYYGATIGRYGNRIAKGHFVLDGRRYDLDINNKPNSLHGGKKGFNDVVWETKTVNDSTITFSYLSKDMEEGYPGNLTCTVTYQLTDDNAMKISYEASTDKNTIINLTNHSYFNLNGIGSGTIINHLLQFNADKYTPIDATSIPTGQLAAVQGTPFDFTTPLTIGSRINTENEQLKNGKGYDHNFVLNKHDFNTPVARITGDKTGITMEVLTDQPGLQFYTGNFMKGDNIILGGKKDDYRTGFAMETQHFPDSPNQAKFPSTELKPEDNYKTVTIYKFITK